MRARFKAQRYQPAPAEGLRSKVLAIDELGPQLTAKLVEDDGPCDVVGPGALTSA